MADFVLPLPAIIRKNRSAVREIDVRRRKGALIGYIV